jgi:2-C-methyl-D-erythritol 2,4-cyclodiphosphate synthase
VRVGQGLDTHALVPGRALVLGGVPVSFERGLAGHSDGDVLLHAVASALLGALGEGDLGTHFPSSDPGLRGIASAEILRRVMERVRLRGFRIGNLDATVVAREPRLAPYREAMQKQIARVLEIDVGQVNVKITSHDGLGALGRGEGISASVVVLLEGEAR